MNNDNFVSRTALIRTALLFLMLAMILKAFAVISYRLHWDTNYYLNIGSNYLERGELTPYMWRLGADTHIIAGSGTGYGIYLLLFWFQIFGLSLMSGYVLMYVLGLIILLSLFFLVKHWWNNKASPWIAVTYIALTGIFIEIFYIRMDTPGILAYTLTLLLHIYAVRKQHFILHVAVGIAAILSTEIHIQALLYLFAFTAYYLWQLVLDVRQRRIFAFTPSIGFFSGAFVAGIIYLIIHVLPDPEAYFIISRTCPYCNPPGILKELVRYLSFISAFPVENLIFVMAIVVSILRSSAADKHLLVLLIGYLIGQTVISPPSQVQYFIHILPLMGVYVGGIFVRNEQQGYALTRLQLFSVGAAATYLVCMYILIISAHYTHTDAIPESVVYTQNYIPNDVAVMTSPVYYHHLLDYPNFMSYPSGERYGIALRDESYPIYLEREAPQVYFGTDYDEILWDYFDKHQFQRVRSNVWVSQNLLETLSADIHEPIIDLSVSDTQLNYGECVTIAWTVEHADAVSLEAVLDYGDPEQQDTSDNQLSTQAQGRVEVCPPVTTTYSLRADWIKYPMTETITVDVR